FKRTSAVATASTPRMLSATATASQRFGRAGAAGVRAAVVASVTARLLDLLRVRRNVAVAADARLLAASDRVGVALVRGLLLKALQGAVTEEPALVFVGAADLDRLPPAGEVIRPEVPHAGEFGARVAEEAVVGVARVALVVGDPTVLEVLRREP